jgi:hypothetical protein
MITSSAPGTTDDHIGFVHNRHLQSSSGCDDRRPTARDTAAEDQDIHADLSFFTISQGIRPLHPFHLRHFHSPFLPIKET